MKAEKRWCVYAAVLLCSLLLVSCARKASEEAKNPSNFSQAQAGQTNSSTTPADDTPTLKTRSTAEGGTPQEATTNSPVTASSAATPLVVPEGASITVRLQDPLSSRYSVPGQRFDAVLEEAIVVDNQVVVPSGSMVTGHVTSARRSGRLRHPGELGLTLDSVTVGDRHVLLATSNLVVRGGSHKKRNLGWIGGGAGGGALIGALAAGGKGALIGSGIGAAAGTTTAFISGKKDVGFSAERRLRFRLNHEVILAG